MSKPSLPRFAFNCVFLLGIAEPVSLSWNRH